MPLSYTVDHKGQNNTVSATITSNTISAATGDFITIIGCFGDNTDATVWTVSNTGTAITWTKQVETNSNFNSKTVLWTGTAGATPPTSVSVQSTSGSNTAGGKSLTTIVHSGAHGTTPLPAGNIFSGTGATDVSQAITPTSTGSCLWLVCSDWIPVDPGTANGMAAGTNCTRFSTYHYESGYMASVVIYPTTQPRTNTSSFTLAELDTGSKIAWVAFEVQASPETYTQEGYRFRNDDGSETTATWKAAQDTTSNVAVSTNFRLRVLIDRTG